MDIRKQLIILILVFLCAPVSAQKKEKLITLKFTNIPLSEAMPVSYTHLTLPTKRIV